MCAAPASRSVLAFDIGGTSTKVALVDQHGDISCWTSFPTQPPRDLYLGRLRDILCRLAETNTVEAIAGAVAGFLSPPGTLTYNPNLPWLEGVDLYAALAPHLPQSLHLENDANAAASAEFLFGSGRGSQRFLCVTGGTGIGVGLLAHGQLLRLAHGGLGDAGHLIIVPDGPLCSCGGHGCAEALLSTAALAHRHTERTGQRHTFRNLVDATNSNHAAARATVHDAGHHLGVLLASLTHIFFPDRISIAGGLSALGETLLSAARASFASHIGHVPRRGVAMVMAHTGANATLQGAAACFLLLHPEPPLKACSLTAPNHQTRT